MGLYRPKPPLIQEVITPLLGNLENVKILHGSQNKEFILANCQTILRVGETVQLEPQESEIKEIVKS